MVKGKSGTQHGGGTPTRPRATESDVQERGPVTPRKERQSPTKTGEKERTKQDLEMDYRLARDALRSYQRGEAPQASPTGSRSASKKKSHRSENPPDLSSASSKEDSPAPEPRRRWKVSEAEAMGREMYRILEDPASCPELVEFVCGHAAGGLFFNSDLGPRAHAMLGGPCFGRAEGRDRDDPHRSEER